MNMKCIITPWKMNLKLASLQHLQYEQNLQAKKMKSICERSLRPHDK